MGKSTNPKQTKKTVKEAEFGKALPPHAPIDATPERIAHAVEHAGNDIVRHHGMVDAQIDKAGERPALTRRFADSHIDRMRKLGRLTYAQWFAADWYRKLHSAAFASERVVANYGEGRGGGGEQAYGIARSEAQAAARKTLRLAREVIPGKMLHLVERLLVDDELPALRNGQQRLRFTASIAASLQRLAEWMHAPGAA